MQTVFFSHLAVHDRTDAERQQAIERRDKCAARIKEGLQFIRDSRLDFSKDIQDLIYEFERSLQHIRDRMTLLLTPDGVDSLLRELKDVLVVTVLPVKERIQAEIDK